MKKALTLSGWCTELEKCANPQYFEKLDTVIVERRIKSLTTVAHQIMKVLIGTYTSLSDGEKFQFHMVDAKGKYEEVTGNGTGIIPLRFPGNTPRHVLYPKAALLFATSAHQLIQTLLENPATKDIPAIQGLEDIFVAEWKEFSSIDPPPQSL